jgi:hypothetical protein
VAVGADDASLHGGFLGYCNNKQYSAVGKPLFSGITIRKEFFADHNRAMNGPGSCE